MTPPFPWYGGKSRMVKHLLPLIPPHKTYVEVFCGAAWLFFAKEPSPIEVLNDVDDGIVNFFRVLRSPKDGKRLQRLLKLTPHSRSEYLSCRETWASLPDGVEKARRWFVVAKMCYGGKFLPNNGWSYSVTQSRRGMSSSVSKFRGSVERMMEVVSRLHVAQVERLDCIDCIRRYDRPDTFFYLDPPYLPETRREKKGYSHEMSFDDHIALLDAVLASKGKFMISGYQSDLYTEKLKGWRRDTFDVKTSNWKRKREGRTECVWMNYDLAG